MNLQVVVEVPDREEAEGVSWEVMVRARPDGSRTSGCVAAPSLPPSETVTMTRETNRVHRFELPVVGLAMEGCPDNLGQVAYTTTLSLDLGNHFWSCGSADPPWPLTNADDVLTVTGSSQQDPPPLPTIRITSPDPTTFSFVATTVNDMNVAVPAGVQRPAGPIQLTATTEGPVNTDQIEWLVVGFDPASGDPPDPPNGAQVSFTPNPTHPPYDQRRNSGGRREPAPPLGYVVRASVSGTTDDITLFQLEVKDIIVQEYVNHSTLMDSRDRTYPADRIPSQSDIGSVQSSEHFGPEFEDSLDGGNYQGIIVNGIMTQMAEQIMAEYNRLIDDDPSTDYGINITSGYRNPERNENVGGVINSFHQDGRAVDLVPVFNVPGRTSSELWCILLDAALTVANSLGGKAQAEQRGTPVPCDRQPDHVHVEIP